MRYLRYPLGILLLASGAVAAGLYLAVAVANPASWKAPSANPAIRFFQSTFFLLGTKDGGLLALFWVSGISLALGAFLVRGVRALLFAAGLGCLFVLGAAITAPAVHAPGGEGRWKAIAAAWGALWGRDGRDLAIVGGMGVSLLLIVAFLNFWGQFTKKKAKPAKPAASAAGGSED